MIISATDIKNNFGKYLSLLDSDEIIITKNGKPAAKLVSCNTWEGINIINDAIPKYNYDSKKVSYEKFLELTENIEARYEYIDGQIYLLASPQVTHQSVLGNLHILLHSYFKDKKCKPYVSPFDVTLKRNKKSTSVVQPDLIVICDDNNRNEKDKYTGTPSLVIEILSPSSKSKDLVKKLDLYMNTGIKEYWVINYFEKEIITYYFENNELIQMKTYTNNSTLKSFVFKGLELELSAIFEG